MSITAEDLGMEAIAFQRNGLLFPELSIFFGTLKGVTEPGRRQEILNNIDACVKARTGIMVTTIIQGDDYNAVAYPPLSAKNHPFYSAEQRLRLAKATIGGLDVDKLLDGTVDLQKSIVSGSFSEIPCSIIMGNKFLSTDLLNPEEVAADYIHEVGHLFVYFMMLGRTYVTNFVLREVLQTFMGHADRTIRIKALESVEKIYGNRFEDKALLAETDDGEVIQGVVLGASIDRVRSDLGTKYYDQRLYEFMSDQFATRHGAGRALVTALDKLGRNGSWMFRDSAYFTPGRHLFANVIDLAVNSISFATTATGGPVAGWGFLRVWRLLLTSKVKDIGANALISAGAGAFLYPLMFGGDKYDDPKARYQAIRREMISELKNLDLDRNYQRQLLEDMEAVEKATDALASSPTLTSVLSSFLFDRLPGKRREVIMQKQVEQLANNDLFAKAAELNQLNTGA